VLLVRALCSPAGRDRCGFPVSLPEAPLQPGGLGIFVSQSGETADTLATLGYAREHRQHAPPSSTCHLGYFKSDSRKQSGSIRVPSSLTRSEPLGLSARRHARLRTGPTDGASSRSTANSEGPRQRTIVHNPLDWLPKWTTMQGNVGARESANRKALTQKAFTRPRATFP
jgi:hypothetical protein